MGKIANFVKEQFDAHMSGNIDTAQLLVNFAEFGRTLKYFRLLNILEDEVEKQR